MSRHPNTQRSEECLITAEFASSCLANVQTIEPATPSPFLCKGCRQPVWPQTRDGRVHLEHIDPNPNCSQTYV